MPEAAPTQICGFLPKENLKIFILFPQACGASRRSPIFYPRPQLRPTCGTAEPFFILGMAQASLRFGTTMYILYLTPRY